MNYWKRNSVQKIRTSSEYLGEYLSWRGHNIGENGELCHHHEERVGGVRVCRLKLRKTWFLTSPLIDCWPVANSTAGRNSLISCILLTPLSCYNYCYNYPWLLWESSPYWSYLYHPLAVLIEFRAIFECKSSGLANCLKVNMRLFNFFQIRLDRLCWNVILPQPKPGLGSIDRAITWI